MSGGYLSLLRQPYKRSVRRPLTRAHQPLGDVYDTCTYHT
jgi:hypothetical protein